MRIHSTLVSLLVVVVAAPVWSQGIQTDGSIETDGQLVSKATSGTAPLAVFSTTKVENLNADSLDGRDSFFFAYFHELEAAFALLDNPDPPCFNTGQRFVDCLNGTVTDTVTGLIYLKDASCLGQLGWVEANWKAANDLFDGCTYCGGIDGDCGLEDGSRPGDWRLPTKEEWEGIVRGNSVCPTAPGIVGNGSDSSTSCYSDSAWASGVVSSHYWSSTTYSGITNNAWAVGLDGGFVTNRSKSNNAYGWPVRGGQ